MAHPPSFYLYRFNGGFKVKRFSRTFCMGHATKLEMTWSNKNESIPEKLKLTRKVWQSSASECFPLKSDVSCARTFLPKHGISKAEMLDMYQGGVSALSEQSHGNLEVSLSCPSLGLLLPSAFYVLNLKSLYFYFCSHREHSREMDPRSQTLLSQCSHHSRGQ